jgi:hypothetical protein
VYAVGHHALIVGQDEALIVDATEPGALEVERTEALGGYVQDVGVSDRDAFLSMGPYGGRRIEVAR